MRQSPNVTKSGGYYRLDNGHTVFYLLRKGVKMNGRLEHLMTYSAFVLHTTEPDNELPC